MAVIERDPRSILGSPRNSSPLMKQDSSSGLFLPEELAKGAAKPLTVDQHLDRVDYSFLNDGSYVPSNFALNFVNFIKLVNGDQGESHPSPVVHMRMLDRVVDSKLNRLANLCSRGIAKTTLFCEYFIMYVAVFGEIEGFGEISGMIYISDSMDNGVKSARKNIEFRYKNSDFMQHWVPEASFTDNYLEFANKDGHQLGVKMFGAKTGLRGTKIFGKRPTIAIMDDLVSDDDAKSKAAMTAIKDTVYKGVDYALDPTRRKIVFNGTPFNKDDILYEAVESGAWEVNVWPICEKFPCTREEFRGAWAERFTYDFVLEQYETSKKTGQLDAFMRELMLRITSEDERLVQPQEIRWYNRQQLLANKSRFNFYITTDWATSEKKKADFTAISVWALNNNGDWFWVDGVRARQKMDASVDDLFRLVAIYKPMNVGVEVTGQQAGFVPWLQREMMARNVWFTFATHGNSMNPGVRPDSDKISRFNLVVPLFRQGKVYYPEELRTHHVVAAHVEEITMATPAGFKSKNDDCADTVSMIECLGAWRPSEAAPMTQDKNGIWAPDETEPGSGGLSSYVA
jgi:predicted phage terminase large subunit-like protein